MTIDGKQHPRLIYDWGSGRAFCPHCSGELVDAISISYLLDLLSKKKERKEV